MTSRPLSHEGERSHIRRGLVVLAGLSLALGGCTVASSPSPTTSGVPASVVTPTEAASAPASGATGEIECNPELKASLLVSGWEVGVNSLKAGDAAFQECYPGIELTYDTSIMANYQLVIAAGKGAPDVGMINEYDAMKFADMNGLVDLTDRVGPYLDKLVGYQWSAGELDGGYYMVPGSPAPVGVFYNRDVFDAAGVDPESIVTWDDYYNAALTIKEKTGLPMLTLGQATYDTWLGGLSGIMMWSRRVNLVDADGAVTLDKDPRVKEILDFQRKLVDEGLTADVESWSDAWYKILGEGKVATLISAVWEGGDLKASLGEEAAGKWGIFKLPVFTDADAHAANWGGWGLAIFKQSTQLDAAWAYVEFKLSRVDQAISRNTGNFAEFPGLYAACDDPWASQTDPFFGDQKANELWCSVLADIPVPSPYTRDYAQMTDILGPYLQKWADGQLTSEDALSQAATDIRSQTGRQ